MEIKTNIDEEKLISNQMSQYNFTIQRCLKVLKEKQAELDTLIRHEEKERVTLQDEVKKITCKLAALNKIKSQRVLMKENYENLIHAIEDDYRRIATLSETLSKTAEQHCLELLDECPVQLKRSNNKITSSNHNGRCNHSKSRGDNDLNCTMIHDSASNDNETFIRSENLNRDDSEMTITKDSPTSKPQSSRNSQTEIDKDGSSSNQILFIKAYKKRKSNNVPSDYIRHRSLDS